MHVLIIEDEPLTALLLRLLSQDCGATSVSVVNTEFFALAAAGAQRPDLVVADLGLEAGDGADAVRSIRAKAGPMPAIFVSAKPHLCGRLGPNDRLLGKPLNERAFTRTFRELQSAFIDRAGANQQPSYHRGGGAAA